MDRIDHIRQKLHSIPRQREGLSYLEQALISDVAYLLDVLEDNSVEESKHVFDHELNNYRMRRAPGNDDGRLPWQGHGGDIPGDFSPSQE